MPRPSLRRSRAGSGTLGDARRTAHEQLAAAGGKGEAGEEDERRRSVMAGRSKGRRPACRRHAVEPLEMISWAAHAAHARPELVRAVAHASGRLAAHARSGSSMDVLALVIFVVALIVIALDWVHRTKVALTGAALVVVLGCSTRSRRSRRSTGRRSGLLAGMMVIVGSPSRPGSSRTSRCASAQLSRGHPVALIFLLAGTTGRAVRVPRQPHVDPARRPDHARGRGRLRISPIPLVLAEVIASNIGGTATLIGDPPNILIGIARRGALLRRLHRQPRAGLDRHAGRRDGLLSLVFRRQLVDRARARGRDRAARPRPRHARGASTSSARSPCSSGRSSSSSSTPRCTSSRRSSRSAGATVMLLVAADDVEDALERVEWSTIFFFVGLFVMVGGLEERGIIDEVAERLADVTDGSGRRRGHGDPLGRGGGLGARRQHPVHGRDDPGRRPLQAETTFDDGLWWSLALGACFGGNATMIAAAANVAATGVLDRTGQPISFVRFLLVGVPVTLVSLVIATAYLLALPALMSHPRDLRLVDASVTETATFGEAVGDLLRARQVPAIAVVDGDGQRGRALRARATSSAASSPATSASSATRVPSGRSAALVERARRLATSRSASYCASRRAARRGREPDPCRRAVPPHRRARRCRSSIGRAVSSACSRSSALCHARLDPPTAA